MGKFKNREPLTLYIKIAASIEDCGYCTIKFKDFATGKTYLHENKLKSEQYSICFANSMKSVFHHAKIFSIEKEGGKYKLTENKTKIMEFAYLAVDIAKYFQEEIEMEEGKSFNPIIRFTYCNDKDILYRYLSGQCNADLHHEDEKRTLGKPWKDYIRFYQGELKKIYHFPLNDKKTIRAINRMDSLMSCRFILGLDKFIGYINSGEHLDALRITIKKMLSYFFVNDRHLTIKLKRTLLELTGFKTGNYPYGRYLKDIFPSEISKLISYVLCVNDDEEDWHLNDGLCKIGDYLKQFHPDKSCLKIGDEYDLVYYGFKGLKL